MMVGPSIFQRNYNPKCSVMMRYLELQKWGNHEVWRDGCMGMEGTCGQTIISCEIWLKIAIIILIFFFILQPWFDEKWPNENKPWQKYLSHICWHSRFQSISQVGQIHKGEEGSQNFRSCDGDIYNLLATLFRHKHHIWLLHRFVETHTNNPGFMDD